MIVQFCSTELFETLRFERRFWSQTSRIVWASLQRTQLWPSAQSKQPNDTVIRLVLFQHVPLFSSVHSLAIDSKVFHPSGPLPHPHATCRVAVGLWRLRSDYSFIQWLMCQHLISITQECAGNHHDSTGHSICDLSEPSW